jgi:conjugal transfer/type IV secretion protein DotA/TraY
MKAIKIIISMLLMALVSQSAFADSFTPVATDKFMIMLNSLFGQLGSFGSAGNDPMIGMISTIIAISLTLAGALAGYLILAATLGTAHDGEMLGKKFSSVWTPIRFSVATALIVPVFNGYAVIHKIVGAIIVMGIGMADYGASHFMSQQNLTTIASASLAQPEPKNLAYNLFSSYACLNTLKKYSKGGSSILYGETDFGLTKEDGLKTTTYLFGNKSGSGNITPDACGKLEISKWQVPPIETNKGLAATLIDASDATARMLVISQTNQAQAGILMTKMDKLASTLVDKEVAVNPKEIEDAIGVYQQAVSKTASEQVLAMDQFSKLKKSVDQDGFIFLGAYYNKISKLIDLANSSIANVPVASGVTNFPVDSLKDRWSTVFKAVAKTVDLSGSGVVNYGIGNEEGGSNDSWMSVIKKSLSNGFDLTVVLKKIFTSSSHLVFNENENMMMKVQRIGGWTMGVASAGFVGVGVASSTIGNAPGIGMFLCSSMLMIVTPLWIFGFTCLYLIPQIPNFIWIGCVVSYLLVCVQSIVGSSLWVVSMLCEGHDIMGQSQNAFKQLITLMLKPLLMVVGFSASVVILQILGTLINSTFVDSWNLSQSDSGFLTYLGGMFAMPFVYVIFAITIIKTCFGVIHTLPDDIMQLIGGVGGSSGGHAKEMSGAVAGGGAIAGIAMGAKGLTNGVQSNMNNRSGGAGGFGGGSGGGISGSGSKNFEPYVPAKPYHGYVLETNAPSVEPDSSSSSKDSSSSSKISSNKEAGYQQPKPSFDHVDETAAKESILEGKNGFQLEKDSSHLNNAMGNIGASGSSARKEMMGRAVKNISNHPEKNLHKNINSAMNSTLNNELGTGVGMFVAKSGGGYTTKEAKATIGMFRDTAAKLKESGMSDDDVKMKIGESVQATYKESDKTMVNSFMSNISKNFGDQSAGKPIGNEEATEPVDKKEE